MADREDVHCDRRLSRSGILSPVAAVILALSAMLTVGITATTAAAQDDGSGTSSTSSSTTPPVFHLILSQCVDDGSSVVLVINHRDLVGNHVFDGGR